MKYKFYTQHDTNLKNEIPPKQIKANTDTTRKNRVGGSHRKLQKEIWYNPLKY